MWWIVGGGGGVDEYNVVEPKCATWKGDVPTIYTLCVFMLRRERKC